MHPIRTKLYDLWCDIFTYLFSALIYTGSAFTTEHLINLKEK